MAVLQAIDTTGDTKTTWDPGNAEEVAAARDTFDALKKKGYVAYSVDNEGEPDSVMSKFDPKAGRIIMRPAMQGG